MTQSGLPTRAVEDRAATAHPPCICDRQHEPRPPRGVAIAVSDARDLVVERIRCTACARTWTRITA